MRSSIWRWRLLLTVLILASLGGARRTLVAQTKPIEFHVLATSKTSTMEKELNEAAEAGYRFESAMGGETAIGGSEVVSVLSRSGAPKGRYTSTASSRRQKRRRWKRSCKKRPRRATTITQPTIFKSTFGGQEVVCILERDKDAAPSKIQFKLVATTKTSTLEKELLEAGAAGYQIMGMTVSKTLIGGKELVAILRRTTAP